MAPVLWSGSSGERNGSPGHRKPGGSPAARRVGGWPRGTARRPHQAIQGRTAYVGGDEVAPGFRPLPLFRSHQGGRLSLLGQADGKRVGPPAVIGRHPSRRHPRLKCHATGTGQRRARVGRGTADLSDPGGVPCGRSRLRRRGGPWRWPFLTGAKQTLVADRQPPP